MTQGDRAMQRAVVGVSSDVANTDRTELPPARVWMPLDPGGAAVRRSSIRTDESRGADLRMCDGGRSVEAPAVPIEYLQRFDDALAAGRRRATT